MGQGSSSQRPIGPRLPRQPEQHSDLATETFDPALRQSRATGTNQSYPTLSTDVERQSLPSSRPLTTFTRQISSHTIPQRNGLQGPDAVSTRNDTFYEQRERRPLATGNDLDLRSTPITHITASPMPRRSRISRLSSVLTPNRRRHESVHEPDIALRRSFIFPGPSHNQPRQRSRRDRRPAIISSPLPLSTSAVSSLPIPDLVVDQPEFSNPEMPTDTDTRASGLRSSPLTARLSRFRHSLVNHLDLADPATRSSRDPAMLSPDIAPARDNTNGEEDPQPSSPSILNERSSLHDVESNTTDPDTAFAYDTGDRNNVGSLNQQAATQPLVNIMNVGRLAGRLHNYGAGNTQGRSSSRLAQQNDESPRSQLLSATALALAAQMSGNSEQSVTNVQSLGYDGSDRRLNPVYQVLHHIIRAHGTENQDMRTEASPALNFLRIFRLVSRSAASSPTATPPSRERPSSTRLMRRSSANGDQSSIEHTGGNVTIVVVAVHSALSDGDPSAEGSLDNASLRETPLDALMSLPTLDETTNMMRSSAGSHARHANRRSRFPYLRRASFGSRSEGLRGFTAFGNGQRPMTLDSRQSANEDALLTSGIAASLGFPDTPPGPIPPPSTPAEHTLSRVSSQPTTPSRRPSIVSSPHDIRSNDYESVSPASFQEGIPALGGESARFTQQRRRSDSESVRHRNLGAGAARRNGVVEPDTLSAGEESANEGQNWLIYIVGTDLSENHPAWAAPSLFTDDPSYEDMLMLSSLLGPAKPPVASSHDVAAAPGVFKLHDVTDGHFTCSEESDDTGIKISSREKCLVCLNEYQVGEEVRQLMKCSHVFHQGCIDEWLTSGRNSCPLCRGQGVIERKSFTTHEGRTESDL